MTSIVVVDKKSLTESTVDGSRVVLDKASKVHTQLYRSDVEEFVQDGNDLILKLKNGQTMVIVNFFVEHDDETSDVFFKDDNGIPWLPLLLGGAGVAGGLALASGGGGSDGNNALKNHAPIAKESAQPTQTLEDQPKFGQITGIEDQDGDKLTYTLGKMPTHGTVVVNEDGTYTYTPNPDYHGEDQFTVVISDGNGGETIVTVPVTITPVNDAPEVKEANQPIETPEDEPKHGKITDVTDKDGDDLTYQVGELPKNGTVVVNEDGTYTYTPNPDYHGEDQFTVVVSDGHGGETVVTVPVTITPVNDAPEAKEASQPIETLEDEPKHGKITDVMDKDGDELTYTLGEMPTHGTVVVNEDGTYTYTPNPDYHGDDQFTVVVSDGYGGETVVTVPVTITPVNDAPEVKEANQPIETLEDEPKHGKITDVTDKDGDDLTYQVGELPKNGTVVVNEDGTYTYTPNPDYHGEDQFTVVVSDGHGGETIVTVPVTITPVNDAPEVKEANQPIETLEDEPKHGKITDVTDKDGDDLTYQVGELPKNGTVVVNEDGTYTYTPNPDYHGDDQFSVVVSDGHGGETIVTVPVTITPVNDAPKAKEANQPIETPEDEPKHGKITDVTDKDGDELTYTLGEMPTHGTVVVNEDGTYTYTPNPDYHGDDQFTVVVSDGHGGETVVSVPVTITPVNDAPKAKEANQPIETPEDEPKHGKITDVTDKDGDELTYTLGEMPTHGTVVVNEDGTYTYTPNPDYHGDDQFTVVVSDGHGGETVVSVPVTITPKDLPIVEAPEELSMHEDGTVLAGNIQASSLTDDQLTYTLVPGSYSPEMGELELNPFDGSFTFTPTDDWSGTVSFDVEVSNSNGVSSTVTQVIDVVPVADQPIIESNTEFGIGQLELNKYVWKGIHGQQVIGGKTYNFDDTYSEELGQQLRPGDGINKDVLVNGINALYQHNLNDAVEKGTTTDLASEGWESQSRPGNGVDAGDVVYINGLVYLEAGKTYKYVGSADDTGFIMIGDRESKYVSWKGVGAGENNSTFDVDETGFYTFDLYIYNQDGVGNYNFKVVEENGDDVKYYPSIDQIEESLSGYIHMDPEFKGTGQNGHYGVVFGYQGAASESIELTDMAASLTDRDGSETLSLELTGLAKGSTLTYTAVDKNGMSTTGEAVADESGKISITGAQDVVEFTDLSVVLPEDAASGKHTVNMTVTATEANGDAKSASTDFDINIVAPTAARLMAIDDSEAHTHDEQVTQIDLLADDATGGHSTLNLINFALANHEEDASASVIKFAPGFFVGLVDSDLRADNSVDVSRFIGVRYDEKSQIATISVDRDGADGEQHEHEDLLLLTNQPTEISLDELLANHQIIIG
ncbi:tandem-95 repeat protein [Wohlfahrtiimonas chitiniclastica]|uniref:tandem-95 repeat protein n=1 Tax=Wohlfahrtiimonas chitiniclastica TaxID=400946 RepID=UPI000B9878FD|nr:Ig-like domain-containing protein [Wohlfahrtiimonas chitiniclastica]OYQ85720.1 hypothetical protein B9T14_04310 [Wohlfahrtiimonas chitiniclastica]OYQ86044.1 hypothetical protein B9T15_00720 [Wohlfahrtiimonas chitiniclastica]